MSTPLALRRAYLHYNRKYFDGKLPLDAEVIWEPLPATLMGYQKDDYKIAVNDKLKNAWTLWRITLLHEMCHLKLGHKISHGRRFQNEMRRLANEGAFDGLW